MSTYPNQTKRPNRLRIALAHCEHWLDKRIAKVGASIGGASLVATISLAVFVEHNGILESVFALVGALMGDIETK